MRQGLGDIALSGLLRAGRRAGPGRPAPACRRAGAALRPGGLAVRASRHRPGRIRRAGCVAFPAAWPPATAEPPVVGPGRGDIGASGRPLRGGLSRRRCLPHVAKRSELGRPRSRDAQSSELAERLERTTESEGQAGGPGARGLERRDEGCPRRSGARHATGPCRGARRCARRGHHAGRRSRRCKGRPMKKS